MFLERAKRPVLAVVAGGGKESGQRMQIRTKWFRQVNLCCAMQV